VMQVLSSFRQTQWQFLPQRLVINRRGPDISGPLQPLPTGRQGMEDKGGARRGIILFLNESVG
jgi:hypothetical protein